MSNKECLWVGLPVECQNKHCATYWYKLPFNGISFISVGVLPIENCLCPKTQFNQGWRRIKGDLIIKQEGEKFI